MTAAKVDRRLERVGSWNICDTPITMGRNRAIEIAKHNGVDFVCMVDSDMYPDMYLGRDPKAKPFWDTALDFLIAHKGPAMIAVPYCGPPPIENIYIFRWATNQSDHPNIDLKIDQFTREEAAVRSGIEEVAALPTGLCMFHLSAVDRIDPPYFYYEWKTKQDAEKVSTEDVTFTRDLAFAGVPVYCAWDCWAGHWKRKCVGRPGLIDVRDVSKKYVQVIRNSFQRELRDTGTCPCCFKELGVKEPPADSRRSAEVVQMEIEEAAEEAQKVIGTGMESKWEEPKPMLLTSRLEPLWVPPDEPTAEFGAVSQACTWSHAAAQAHAVSQDPWFGNVPVTTWYPKPCNSTTPPQKDSCNSPTPSSTYQPRSD